ncbi:PQQ-binding-like beta-propeller repeat protein [Novipirellula artificiosorum]|uniref:Outer membrane protein assembly factor BamB n=1 Tax=Novipirellula artificiosorum TaxID=2528016 RepID=A0A5C6DXR3_9BACT|nr:PQQ-binding-like beta-propeller repeat protein [Novipirellula artificiosorum]TWU39619.1 Outer membrane protein assembly factor BamB precursor [Novipirellula artificiosorum]
MISRSILFSVYCFAFACPALISQAVEPSKSALPAPFEQNDLLWELTLASRQYTTPVLDNGQLFLGMNDYFLEHPAQKTTGGGLLQCRNPETGALDWQMVIPRFEEGDIAPSHFNRWTCGLCSRPALDESRLYIVSPRGDILCLDRKGQADGNDGPFKEEAAYMELPDETKIQTTDGDIIWAHNMLEENKVVPHDVCGSSPLLVGNYLYACTSNGQDNKHQFIVNPKAPALIVLNKDTGQLAAVENEGISSRTFHCNWSSPVAAEVNGETLVLFGGGDGILYAFEPVTATTGQPQTLKKRWQYDCCPERYRIKDGQLQTYSNHSKRSQEGPSEIIAIPTVVDGRVYVPIGQSPNHGPGQGMLSCVDVATGKMIWESDKVARTTAQPCVKDGLVYISDYSGNLSCLDADSGELYWQHDMESGAWCASPVVIGENVYISTEKRVMWILKTGTKKEVLHRARFRLSPITPMAQDGTIYIPTQRHLFALKASF